MRGLACRLRSRARDWLIGNRCPPPFRDGSVTSVRVVRQCTVLNDTVPGDDEAAPERRHGSGRIGAARLNRETAQTPPPQRQAASL